MARPKTKSALVEGISELVTSLRNIESKISKIFVGRHGMMMSGPKSVGRPPGTGKKRGRPAGNGRGPGRPPGSANKRKPGRPASGKKRGRPAATNSAKRRGRGRPKGSKNKN